MNINNTHVPEPIIDRFGVAIWMIEDVHIIYDREHKIWSRAHLDVPKNGPALPLSTNLADAFLEDFQLSTDKLVHQLGITA